MTEQDQSGATPIDPIQNSLDTILSQLGALPDYLRAELSYVIENTVARQYNVVATALGTLTSIVKTNSAQLTTLTQEVNVMSQTQQNLGDAVTANTAAENKLQTVVTAALANFQSLLAQIAADAGNAAAVTANTQKLQQMTTDLQNAMSPTPPAPAPSPTPDNPPSPAPTTGP